MIHINVLPEQRRKRKAGLNSQSWLKIPLDSAVGISAAVVGVLILSHVLLTGIALISNMRISGSEKKWTHLSGEKQNIDAVMAELRNNRDKLKSIKEISEGKVLQWSHILNVLSDALPKGLWLKQLSLQDKVLLVEGSTVSKVNNEMISVGNYVSKLKGSDYILNNFEDFEVGSIQRRRESTLGVADFSFSLNLKK